MNFPLMIPRDESGCVIGAFARHFMLSSISLYFQCAISKRYHFLVPIRRGAQRLVTQPLRSFFDANFSSFLCL